MTAKEFLALDLKYGDRVRVTLGTTEHEGFFGGYKAFEGSHSCLEYALNPIFYDIGKNEQMVRRSMVPGISYWGFSTISKIEKVSILYRWKGYIDNVKDSVNAALRGPKVILNEWKKHRETGKSAYRFCDVDNENVINKTEFTDRFTTLNDGKYAVYIYKQNEKFAFVRIFERVERQ